MTVTEISDFDIYDIVTAIAFKAPIGSKGTVFYLGWLV